MKLWRLAAWQAILPSLFLSLLIVSGVYWRTDHLNGTRVAFGAIVIFVAMTLLGRFDLQRQRRVRG